MADKGDMHFVITAEDQASGVLSSFRDHASAVASEFVSISHQFDVFGSQAGDAVDAVDELWGVIDNPTPVAGLTAALGIAGTVFLEIKRLTAESRAEFDQWNESVASLKSSWDAIEGLHRSNDTFGMPAEQKAALEFLQAVNAQRPSLSPEDQALRAKLRASLDPSKYLSPDLADEARRKIAEIDQKEADLREAYERNAQNAVTLYNEVWETQRALQDDARQQLEIERAKTEELNKQKAAERELLTLMDTISRQARADEEARQKAAERSIKARAQSVTEANLTQKERNDREAYELGIMAMFGDITPETYRRAMAKQRGGASGGASAAAGYVPNRAVESRNLTRGGGDSFDPALAELKRQSNLAQETKDNTAKAWQALERLVTAMEKGNQRPQLHVLGS